MYYLDEMYNIVDEAHINLQCNPATTDKELDYIACKLTIVK